MKQLTIRGIPDEVQKVIEREAKRKRKSKNKIVVSLLEQATGVKSGKSSRVELCHDLDHLSGLWSAKEGERFEKHLVKQRKIDEDLWK
jgi:hypothetical protein